MGDKTALIFGSVAYPDWRFLAPLQGQNLTVLCADGGIYNEGSDGASYSTWCIRDIKNGRIVVREGVQTTDKTLENGDIEMAYLRMTESHKLYDGEEISEAQADADVARYQSMLLTDDSGFVSFAEYKKK